MRRWMSLTRRPWHFCSGTPGKSSWAQPERDMGRLHRQLRCCLLRGVKVLPGERCQYHSCMLFRRSLVRTQEILRSSEAVANGIDMYPQLLSDCLRRAKRLGQYERVGQMRTIGGIILQEWGEQSPGKGVQVFSEPGILQEAVQAKGGDI